MGEGAGRAAWVREQAGRAGVGARPCARRAGHRVLSCGRELSAAAALGRLGDDSMERPHMPHCPCACTCLGHAVHAAFPVRPNKFESACFIMRVRVWL
eukprot:363597-Chlamydomonas_euryale.AAC.12